MNNVPFSPLSFSPLLGIQGIIPQSIDPRDHGIIPWISVITPTYPVQLSPKQTAFFWEKGYVAQQPKERIYIAPIVELDPNSTPTYLYHVTPLTNQSCIEEKGLLTGLEVGKSTTGRKDASSFIFVSLSRNHALRWKEILSNGTPINGWCIFEIDLEGIKERVIHDPASETGYILEQKRVDRKYITLSEVVDLKQLKSIEGAVTTPS